MQSPHSRSFIRVSEEVLTRIFTVAAKVVRASLGAKNLTVLCYPFWGKIADVPENLS